MANPRNLVSGQVNTKKLNKSILSDIDFIAYEIIHPWTDFKTQYKTLEELDFDVPNYQIVKHIDMDILSTYLKNHKKKSEYEIDGIIISDTNLHKRYTSGNPEYSFAFKELLEDQIAEVKVLDVEWNVSKDGYIKPKLILEPVKLSGVTIKNVTAFNAKFIKDNKLGPGSIIKLTRSGDVIPHIVGIVKSTKAKFPSGDWIWNVSGVDIIMQKKNYQQRIKEITFFLKNLDVKHIDEKIVEKLYNLGYTNINKYFSFDKKHLMNTEGFKETMINKIDTEITNALDNMSLLKLMTASNIFGHGIGEKKLKKILDLYPDIILKKYLIGPKEFYNLIINIYGFDTITTDQFIKNMKKFCNFFFELPKKYRNKVLIETIVFNKFSKVIKKKTISPCTDKQFVFSDFRNKQWEQYIETNGGKITSTVSKNTDYLVTTLEQIKSASNSKVIKANKLGISIIDKDTFASKFIN
jgi:NAD-dependent DNA ligase